MRIFVGNLPYSFSEEDLKELFAEYPSCSSFKLIIDHASGRSKGFGFVDVDSDDEAREAIKALNQKVVNGQTLTVNEARPHVKRDNVRRGGDRDRSSFSNQNRGRF